MDKGVCFVDIVEAGEVILNAISSENTKNALKNQSEEFKRGAMWGMAWASTNILAYCSKYEVTKHDKVAEQF